MPKISFSHIALVMDHLIYAKNKGDMKKIAKSIKAMVDVTEPTLEILRKIYQARLEDLTDGDAS
jgi:hypothetical protein